MSDSEVLHCMLCRVSVVTSPAVMLRPTRSMDHPFAELVCANHLVWVFIPRSALSATVFCSSNPPFT